MAVPWGKRVNFWTGVHFVPYVVVILTGNKNSLSVKWPGWVVELAQSFYSKMWRRCTEYVCLYKYMYICQQLFSGIEGDFNYNIIIAQNFYEMYTFL